MFVQSAANWAQTGAEFFSQSDRALWKALVTTLLARLANSGSLQNLLSNADFDDNVSKKNPAPKTEGQKAQDVKRGHQQCLRTIKTKVRLMFIVQAPKTRSPSLLQLHFRHQFGSLPIHFRFHVHRFHDCEIFQFHLPCHSEARLFTHISKKICEDLLHVQNKCLAIRLSEGNP